jgi:hypothetical protein
MPRIYDALDVKGNSEGCEFTFRVWQSGTAECLRVASFFRCTLCTICLFFQQTFLQILQTSPGDYPAHRPEIQHSRPNNSQPSGRMRGSQMKRAGYQNEVGL